MASKREDTPPTFVRIQRPPLFTPLINLKFILTLFFSIPYLTSMYITDRYKKFSSNITELLISLI